MLYLYNPINNVKTKTSYELLEGITGRGYNNLASMKCKHRKLKELNCYIIDENFDEKTLHEFMMKEQPKDEIWKTVDLNQTYLISNHGRVKRVYKNGFKLLTPYKKHGKRLVIKINNGEKIREYYIDDLVAKAFLECEEGMCKYHKDGNIYNNHANNIGFITRKELGKISGHKSGNLPILKIDIETAKILDEYDSIREAGRENYISHESIRLCIKGKQKTAGGFKWVIDEEFLKGSEI